jgi:hypothetical protein
VSPSTIAQSGDVPITVTGFGFPFKPNNDFTFKLCGTAVTLSKISNTELVFTAPARPSSGCTSGAELEIQWTGTTAKTAALTYDANLDMSITAISPVTASHVEKATLVITGTNFGTSTTGITVTLVGTKTYKLGVNAVTNTEIRATLGGGVTGAYKVIVSKQGAATAVPNPSTANDLKYEMVITSISPAEGSKFGGSEITITGRGFPFSDKDLTAVIFGEVSNNFCIVKTSSLNQVVCTSPMMTGTQAVGTSLKLHLYGRYIEEASCDPATACDFTFKDTATPSVIGRDS